MTNRESTLLAGRVKRIEQVLDRPVAPAVSSFPVPLKPGEREHLKSSAEELYWNELAWENITGEEQLDGDFLTELAFPGFLAFVRGLLLAETMPDSLAPPRPSPEVVQDVLDFLAMRVVELDEDEGEVEGEELEHRKAELEMTNRLIDFVLYDFYGLDSDEVERVEAALLSG